MSAKQVVVKGHTLPFEGKTPDQWRYRSHITAGATTCSCGERSPVLPTTAARQRWHREHKLAVLKQGETAGQGDSIGFVGLSEKAAEDWFGDAW